MAELDDGHREELRRLLLSERRRLLVQVVRVEDDLQWFDTNVETELLEEGQEQTLANLLERLDDHDLVELSAVDRALERLHRGDYGHCAGCGESIPLARLLAMPAAELCLQCAEMREGLERV